LKNSNRLDYASLAEVLGQRGLVDPGRLKLALQASQKTPVSFPEMLVSENLIGDWELSRLVCEIFGLPFLPIDLYPPSASALQGLDHNFLRQYALIPLSRHGQILTVCMPALVPAEVLGQLAASTDLHVMPVVGTVNSNNRWLAENLAVQIEVLPDDGAPGWSNVFDEADAAVLLDLNAESEGPQDPLA
jgi:MshEN domain